MRLLELQLVAFGPFSEVVLDFSRERDAMQLIYGRNEAGKSTALRAIRDVLFGIPATTNDAHFHAMPKLRIGAKLESDDGSVLELLRRKGRKDTLLRPDGTPMDEAVLQRVLGGVGRSLFSTMFGLDHVSLREGAEALLAGQGDVGESLFDAGGARGVHRVLGELREQAEALFKPRGQTPKLNEALKAFTDAKQRAVLAEVGVEAWRKQNDALQQAMQEHGELQTERRELGAERSRLQRALAVLPHLAKRHELAERRSALGEVATLAADAGERRLQAERLAGEAARDQKRLQQELATIAKQASALGDDEELGNIDETLVESIQRRLGRHLASAAERPQHQGALARLEEEARALLRELGSPLDLAQVEQLRADTATVARVEELGQQRGAREAELRAAEQQRDERLGELGQLRLQLNSVADGGDTRALAAALTRARREGDLDELQHEGEAELARLREATVRMSKDLGIDLQPERSSTLELPTIEQVQRHEEALRDAEGERQKRRERGRELEQQRRDSRRDLRALEHQGELPSETRLEQARRQRDETWQALRDHGRVTKERADELERAVEEADQLADRLRREAGRVAQRARLVAELEALEQASEAHEQDDQEASELLASLHERWRAAWQASGIEAGDPSRMRDWLDAHRQLLDAHERASDQDARLELLRERRRAHIERTARELAELGRPKPPSDSLSEHIDLAEIAVEELQGARRHGEQLRAAVQQHEHALKQLELEHGARREAFDAWQLAWKQAMERIRMPANASVAEARSVLGLRSRLFEKVATAEELRARIATISGAAEQFEADVRRIASPHLGMELGDHAAASVEELADSFARAYRTAREGAKQRTRLADERQERERALSDVQARAADADAALEELMRAAQVDDIEGLAAAELRTAEALALDEQQRAVEDELFAAGEGASLEELAALAREVDVDALKIRLEELAERSEQLNDRIDSLSHDIGSHRLTLERYFEDRPGAHDASEEAQAQLATVGRLARRYAALRLGIELLEQEIERYRRENQGPILRRAGELFPELTLGRFRELSVELGERDKVELRCVRGDGKELGVGQLSDGTRDQLYLALRLASMERYGERSGPMPLVLDDVLIHFDDERARAALEVLCRFARRNQVLFFTHHARLRDLARDASGGRLQEHELTVRRIEARAG